MNVIVLLKQVPDTEAVIKIKDNQVDSQSVPKWIISPYDEYALEEGIKIKEKTGGSVTAITVGPDKAVDVLRTAYAVGATKAVHIKMDNYNPFDGFAIASALEEVVKGEEYDVILSGQQSIDSSSGQVPAILAEKLGIAQAINVIELTVDGGKFTAKKESEGGSATVEGATPVMITAQKGLNEPRYPSLKGIMAAKKKKIEASSANAEASITILSAELPPPRPDGRILEAADAASYATALVDALKNEVKVI